MPATQSGAPCSRASWECLAPREPRARRRIAKSTFESLRRGGSARASSGDSHGTPRMMSSADPDTRCAPRRFAISSSFMGRLVARGKYLFEGAEKFYVRGVSYGPFVPNSRAERYPEPERAAADFALMRELGANLVRLYVPPPPWMVEEAGKAGLRLMVGIPWPYHMAFLDSRDMKRDIRETIRKTVTEMRGFGETIAAYLIANEIRSYIARWHRPPPV